MVGFDVGRIWVGILMKNGEICNFLGRTREWYQYQKLVQVPIVQKPSGTSTHLQNRVVPVPIKVVPVPMVPATLFLHIFAPLSPRIRTPIV